ncbi:hypothetical protein BH11ARM2_BH11ARM2_39660 [soil metagenome]
MIREQDLPELAGRLRWQEHMGQIMPQVLENSRQFDLASADLREDMRAAGWDVNPAQLPYVERPYPELIPVFLRHLRRITDVNVQSAVFAALAVPYAGEAAARALMDWLKELADQPQMPDSVIALPFKQSLIAIAEWRDRVGPQTRRGGLLNALVECGDSSLVPEMEGLRADPRYEELWGGMDLFLRRHRKKPRAKVKKIEAAK